MLAHTDSFSAGSAKTECLLGLFDTSKSVQRARSVLNEGESFHAFCHEFKIDRVANVRNINEHDGYPSETSLRD